MTLYRLLLHVFPRAFRERFGDDMADVFADRLRAARTRGALAVAWCWIRTVVDVAMGAWAERSGARGRTTSRDGRTTMEWRMDVRQAWRSMKSQRGFSVAVIVTLGLGIGAATSVFSVANALVLRALPYPQPDRLLRLYELEDQQGFSGNVALGNLEDWCSIAAFEACGAYANSDVNLAGGDTPDRVRSAGATSGIFATLGVRPSAGRLFSAEEADSKAPVALLSEAASRRLSNGGALGQTLRLDGALFTVVGILPPIPGFEDVAVWRPLPTSNQTRGNHANRAIARLRPDASVAVAQAQLDAASRRLQQAFSSTNAHWWGRVEPLHASLTEGLDGTLRVLAALAATLLALCVAGVAALVVGQGASRRQELGVRMALGASRARLVAQLFVEHAALAVVGAIAGTLVAHWSLGAILGVLPSRLALWREPGVDLATLGFAVAIAMAACVCFGLLPAASLVKQSQASAGFGLRQTSGRSGRTRSTLAVVQVALATVLLSAAAILGTALLRVLRADPGFNPDNVLTFTLTPPRASYADAAALSSFYDDVRARLQRLPEVEAVAATMNVPMSGSSVQRGVVRDGEAIPARGHARLVLFQVATPGYFDTVGIRLADGRDFNADDSTTGPPVAIVNQMLANRLWPGERAVGHSILVHTDETRPRLVVGVIADAKQARYESAIQPEYYVPLSQSPRRSLSFVVRQRAPVTRAILQREVSAIDPALPIYDLESLDALMTASTSARRAVTKLAGGFGLTAVLLAAVGLYGLVAGGVIERTREIGVRVAIGATPGDVVGLLLRRGLITAGIGALLGLGAAAAISRVLAPLLASTPPDPALAAAVVAVVLVVTCALACWLPSRRAMRIDPLEALKE